MNPSYIAAAVVVLAQVLPWIGINLDATALTTTITTLVTVASGIVVLVHQLKQGNTTVFGSIKK